jgi:hypothetical protein
MKIFDLPHEQHITNARLQVLYRIIEECNFGISTALDAGTGVGAFASNLFCKYKFQVTAFDARPSNVEEAQKRYPEIKFVVGNVENPEIVQLGKFDLVTAFGLFYHLENPFIAAQNLAQMTQGILVVESMIAPGRELKALLIDEYPGEDQAIRYVAFHLTESGLIKLLYRSGMPYVYRPTFKVDHEDFRGGLFRRRMRTILIASRFSLDSTHFKLVPEPHYGLDRPYYYRTPLRPIFKFMLTLFRSARQALVKASVRQG